MSLVLTTQSVNAVFCPAVFCTTRQVVKINCIASYEKSEQIQQTNVFKRKTHFLSTRLQVRPFNPLTFHFLRVQIHVNIYPITVITRRSDRMRESTAAIVASVVETTRRPGSSSSTTLSRPRWANFLHQACIAGLVKHLSPYTRYVSDWMTFVSSSFAHRKRVTERFF